MEILNGIPPAQQLAPNEATVRWTTVTGSMEFVPAEEMFIRVAKARRRITKIHVHIGKYGYAALVEHIGPDHSPTKHWWDLESGMFDLNWEAHPEGLHGHRSGKYLPAPAKAACWRMVKRLRHDLLREIDRHDADALL